MGSDQEGTKQVKCECALNEIMGFSSYLETDLLISKSYNSHADI